MPDPDAKFVDDTERWWEQQVRLDETYFLPDRKHRLAEAWRAIEEKQKEERRFLELLNLDIGGGS